MGHQIEIFIDDDGHLVDIQRRPWSPVPAGPPPKIDRNNIHDQDVLMWLLSHCDVDNPAELLERYPPERILLACCRGLHQKKRNQLRTGSPRPLILYLLQQRAEIPDHRSEILADLQKSAGKGSPAIPAKAIDSVLASIVAGIGKKPV